MNQENLKTIHACIADQTVLEAQVKSVITLAEQETDALQLILGDVIVYIPRDEIDITPIKKSLARFVGKTIKFVVTEIDEESGIAYASRRTVKLAQQASLLEKMRTGESFPARITYIHEFGAYLSIEGVSVSIRNRDFSTDHTAVRDVYAVGDTIQVRLGDKNDKARIYVVAETPYTNPDVASIADFERGELHFGEIRTLKSWGCYVRIAQGLDALAPIPEYAEYPLEVGTKVVIALTSVNADENRLRGKIVRVLTHVDEAHLD